MVCVFLKLFFVLFWFRHLERHAREEAGPKSGDPKSDPVADSKTSDLGDDRTSEPAAERKPPPARSNLVQCHKCDKKLPKNTIKRHLQKHKRLGDKFIAWSIILNCFGSGCGFSNWSKLDAKMWCQ